MLSLLKSLFVSERRFSTYDECPEIFFRFNGKGAYGPHKLEKVVTYKGLNPTDVVEARFSDEKVWHPRKHFLQLWEKIPPSEHSRKRLANEGIQFAPEISEPEARRLLKECQKVKTPTATQLSRLQRYGVSTDGIASRTEAARLIAECEKRDTEAQEKVAHANRQIEEAPKIEHCRERLAELKTRVGMLVSDWRPKEPKDLSGFLDFLTLAEEALDYAQGFDVASLHSGPFYDPGTSRDYYIEIETDPSDSEMNAFQGSIFLGYLRKGSDGFGHLQLLKKNLPSVVVSPL